MLTQRQIHEAIEQMLTQCELKQETYEPVSARAVLYELGYDVEDADQVLQFVFKGGFEYCLDPQFAATHFDPNNPAAVNGMVTDRPGPGACYWGPDQLASRLSSLSNYRPVMRERR